MMLDPEERRERATRIRLVCFDVDGSLTDGRLWFNAHGEETKAFHVHDGQGLRLLEDHGIAVALITARDSAAARARGEDLRLRHIFTGVKDKRGCLADLCLELGLGREQAAYFGDDLPDLAAFSLVGLTAAPVNAHPWVREQAHWISAKRGGEGAAREFCDLILEAQGWREAILNRFLDA
jgi:3-deoxy-D-manno-octulosonate 8-phosphate phosphatase (KDO 8-P phosphatase)